MSLICFASSIFMRHNVFRLTVPLEKCTSSSLRKLYLMLKLTEFIGKGAAPLAVSAENGKTGCGVPLIFRLLKLWIFMREVLKKLYFLAERPNSLFRLFLF